MVLLKATIDSLPIFWFSLFAIPTTILNKIDKLRRYFLWGHNHSQTRKLHLLSWNKLTMDKKAGGLGLFDLKQRNLALLAKWWLRSYNE